MANRSLILYYIIVLITVITAKSGNVCNNTNKKCVKSYKCPYNDNPILEDCGFKNGINYVCCPRTGLEAYDRCKDYAKKIKNLYVALPPTLEPHLHDHAYIVALGYGIVENIQWKCTGTIISSKFVLTAAHCVNLPNFGRVKYARMETENLNIPFDSSYKHIPDALQTQQPRQDFSIVYTVLHPDYDPNTRANNVALLKLNGKVQYSIYAKPACLEINPIINETVEWQLTTVGWGLENQHEPLKLFKYNHYIVPQKECALHYQQLGRIIDFSKQFCLNDRLIHSLNEVRLKSFCYRYSGEPIVGYNTELNMPTVVGVASFGDDCKANSAMPGTYTAISPYVSWIENVVWD